MERSKPFQEPLPDYDLDEKQSFRESVRVPKSHSNVPHPPPPPPAPAYHHRANSNAVIITPPAGHNASTNFHYEDRYYGPQTNTEADGITRLPPNKISARFYGSQPNYPLNSSHGQPNPFSLGPAYGAQPAAEKASPRPDYPAPRAPMYQSPALSPNPNSGQMNSFYPPSSAPVVVQPGALAFNQTKLQPGPYGVPSAVSYGLEYLASLDYLFVRQRKELVEVFLGCETKNKYRILDSYGRQVFYAKEDTDICTRQCCGYIRPFDMILTDESGEEVIHFSRPLRCDSCCCPCFLQELEVQSPAGIVIGTVEQKWSIIFPKFYVKNAMGQVVFCIEGPCWTMSCCCNDVEFKIFDGANKSVEVGRISKKWSGLAKEWFTDADNFGIHFPANVDVKMKAVLLGACMLIDFMYFEH